MKQLITRIKNFQPFLNFVAALPCKTNTGMNACVKLWRFCIEKHQTSFLQICGLQTDQISIKLITRSGLSCSVVYTREKSTTSTNWSRGWLKPGVAFNSRLSTWLLISDTEDLELVFVWREDTSNTVFELTDCLDFVNFLSPSLLCFVEILHCWVKQRCCNVHIHTSVSFKCSNKVKVWWEIFHSCYQLFPSDSNSKRILKIDQHLPKLQ